MVLTACSLPPCSCVQPTLLAGDRSLVDVVAHEITHSWTGNLVTNRTWKHFWLNEGWTKYVERKIVERLRGKAVAELTCYDGLRALQDSVSHFGEGHEFTKLMPDLHDVDPDDAFSSVPCPCAHLQNPAPSMAPDMVSSIARPLLSFCR